MKLIIITGSSPTTVAAAAIALASAPTLNPHRFNRPIVLTDPPAVVDLKREFRELDSFEQELKIFGAEAQEDLDRVRRRKAAIAREIFALPSRQAQSA